MLPSIADNYPSDQYILVIALWITFKRQEARV